MQTEKRVTEQHLRRQTVVFARIQSIFSSKIRNAARHRHARTTEKDHSPRLLKRFAYCVHAAFLPSFSRLRLFLLIHLRDGLSFAIVSQRMAHGKNGASSPLSKRSKPPSCKTKRRKKFLRLQRYCSICRPTMLAVVSATLSSVSPMRAAGSRESSTTAPMDSPSAIIGQMTWRGIRLRILLAGDRYEPRTVAAVGRHHLTALNCLLQITADGLFPKLLARNATG